MADVGLQENYRVPNDAPSATREQASALEGIAAFIADPTSWPASAWEDRDVETYVPSRYQVWLRLFPDQGPEPDLSVGAREWALLPASATDVLRLGKKMHPAFYELTTDDTRALAEALNQAGLEPFAVPGEAVLRYRLEDPYQSGNSLYLSFGPVLPHGEAIFLGPGDRDLRRGDGSAETRLPKGQRAARKAMAASPSRPSRRTGSPRRTASRW